MKILMFNYEYPPVGGGGGVAHELIAQGLARRHQVHVITSRFQDLPHRDKRGGVQITRVPVAGRSRAATASLTSMVSYPPSAWWEAWKMMREIPFDIVNAYFAVPTGPGSLPPALLAGVPHVTSILGGDIFDPSKRTSPHRLPPVRWVVERVLANSDAVVAESRDTKENVDRYYRYEGRIRIIPLAVNKPTFSHVPREELELPGDSILLVSVGRLVKRKGIDLLLRALRRVRYREVFLVIVGTGPERENLESLADELGLASKVRFTGWVDEAVKWQILESADMYVSGTMHEGYGLVFQEALAAGLPIIAPDRGGHLDFLTDRETGLIVPAGNRDALAAAIDELAAKPELRARIGASNRDRFDAFSVDGCVRAYEDLFLELIAAGDRTSDGVRK